MSLGATGSRSLARSFKLNQFEMKLIISRVLRKYSRVIDQLYL